MIYYIDIDSTFRYTVTDSEGHIMCRRPHVDECVAWCEAHGLDYQLPLF